MLNQVSPPTQKKVFELSNKQGQGQMNIYNHLCDPGFK